jgi:hypothetical protein
VYLRYKQGAAAAAAAKQAVEALEAQLAAELLCTL